MATINFAIEEIETRGDHGHIVTWTPLGSGDDGAPLSMVGSARRTVQVFGTFAAGSKLEIEGSNDGTNFALLSDDHGNELKFNAAGISTVAELTRHIRPRVTAGAPTLTVVMLVRKEVRT